MQAGQLRHRLLFQIKPADADITPDSFGTRIETYSDDFTVPGAYEPLGSREFPANQKRYAETTARFRIRYKTGIDPERHRIRFTMSPDAEPVVYQTFNIFPPLPTGGKRVELLIEAVEIT